MKISIPYLVHQSASLYNSVHSCVEGSSRCIDKNVSSVWKKKEKIQIYGKIESYYHYCCCSLFLSSTVSLSLMLLNLKDYNNVLLWMTWHAKVIILFKVLTVTILLITWLCLTLRSFLGFPARNFTNTVEFWKGKKQQLLRIWWNINKADLFTK